MFPGAAARSTSARIASALARGVLAASALAASGCSLVLDFDVPTDAAPPDSPATPAQCMLGEPNDSAATAITLGATDVDAAICGDDDHDFYRLTILDGQSITATITFDNRGGAGDLELRLLSNDGASVYDESRTSNDTETVMCPGGSPCPALTAGDYVVEVIGFNETIVSPYILHVVLSP